MMKKVKDSKEYDLMLFEYIEKELGIKKQKKSKSKQTKEQEVKA